MSKQNSKLGAEKTEKTNTCPATETLRRAIKFSIRCYCLCKLGPQYVHVLLYMIDLSDYVIYVTY